MSYSSSSMKLGKKRNPYVADTMQYNRVELMRAQAMGTEIVINPKPQPAAPRAKPVNPATVTINNLNITTNANEADYKEPIDEQSETKKVYEAKEDVKRIQVRHKQNWFTLNYKNADEFYQFLDDFCIFGLLSEENGCLIITNYDDLQGENKKYRTVAFNQFDKWKPAEIESESKEFKKFYSAQNMIKTKGVCTKNEQTIGIRHKFIWLQLTIRFEWEFDKLLKDSNVYGLVDEHSALVVRKFEDLEVSDYRLFDVKQWDKYNDPEKDGKTFSGMVQANDAKTANDQTKKNKKKQASSGWFGSKTSTT